MNYVYEKLYKIKSLEVLGVEIPDGYEFIDVLNVFESHLDNHKWHYIDIRIQCKQIEDDSKSELIKSLRKTLSLLEEE